MPCAPIVKFPFLFVLGILLVFFPAPNAKAGERVSPGRSIDTGIRQGCISPQSWFTPTEPGGNGRATHSTVITKSLELVCFPFIQGAVSLDHFLYFIGGRYYWSSQKIFRHIHKLAFKNSIVLIVDEPGREIKFMDNRLADPKREFIGWGKMIPGSPGTLDINYQVKAHDAETGRCRYLTRFTGDDILEYILDYFGDDVERIHSLLERSNLEAFNLAYARKPGDVLYALKNTHFGNFIINQKGWRARSAEIIPEGEAGRMRPGIVEPARAAFYNVEITVHRPFTPEHPRKLDLWTTDRMGWEIGWNLGSTVRTSA